MVLLMQTVYAYVSTNIAVYVTATSVFSQANSQTTNVSSFTHIRNTRVLFPLTPIITFIMCDVGVQLKGSNKFSVT